MRKIAFVALLFSVLAVPLEVFAVSLLEKVAKGIAPECHRNPQVLAKPLKAVIPAQTLIKRGPGQSCTIVGTANADLSISVVGEVAEWYVVEIPADSGGTVPLYVRKADIRVETTSGAVATATTAGLLTSQTSQPDQGAMDPSDDSAPPATKPPLALPPGVEFEKSNRRCVKPTPPGGYPDVLAEGIDATLYVPEDFAITDEAKVRETLLYGAAGVRAICGAGASDVWVKIHPIRDKPIVARSSALQFGGLSGHSEWAYGRMRYDQASGQYHLGSYQNAEDQRRKRCAPLAEFFKRTGVQSVADIKDLTANPFVYEGKKVAVRATFVEMISRNEAIFGRESFIGPVDNFVATGVPTTRFGGAKKLVLVGRVNGKGKHTMPSGQSVLIAELAFVDAYDQEIDDEDIEPAFKDSQR